MHFTSGFLLAISAGFVAAQTTTSSAAGSVSTTCAAANIVQACLGTYQPQLQACASTDYACLCNQATNVQTCYNNCPGDPNGVAQKAQVTAYCNAASEYGSSTSSSASASGSMTGSSSGSMTTSASGSAMGTTAGSSTKPTGSAGASSSSSSPVSSSNAGQHVLVTRGDKAAWAISGIVLGCVAVGMTSMAALI